MNRRGLVGASLVFVVSACGGSADPGTANNGASGAAGHESGSGGSANSHAGTGSGGKNEAGGSANEAGGSADEAGGKAGGGRAGAPDEQAGAGGADEQAGASDTTPDADAEHCTSGVRDADETDKDCGGASCTPCKDTLHCALSADCASKVCSNNSCQHPTCSDQAQNQDESDTDCGGVCADTNPCANAAGCNVASDCESYVCSNQQCVADLVVPPADVIDDFEDGDVLLPTPAASHGNRVGTWFVFGDGTSGIPNTRAVVAMKRGLSLKVLHTTGVGFRDWGSGIGVDFDNDGTTKTPYDASQYTRITFWARAGKASNAWTVSLTDVNTDSTVAGHTCSTCDHFFRTAMTVSTDWQRITIPFSVLMAEPGTVPAPTALAVSGLASLRFLKPTVASVNESYDLWLDDVAFLP